MPARWSADAVLALAPDESSRHAAAGLRRPAPWAGTGAAGDLVWGLCAGSGQHPYQAVADLSGPAYKCSCPSRKFPCKHVLGLLLLWSDGAVPDQAEPADYAQAWLASRRGKPSRSADAAGAADAAGDGEAGEGNAARAEAAARRAAQRAQRVASGLADVTEWLRDQVRVGLAAAAPSTEAIAARMVDAQAPGVAAVLRGLAAIPASRQDWPARLLGEYALLHLLARAHGRVETLPPELAAVIRSRVGYTTGRQEVLARPAVTDHWAVLGVRDLVDGQVPARRIWLRGRETGRFAMLLTFAGNGFWQDPETARLRAGTELHASLHYYPGQPALRALAGERHAPPARAKPPLPAGDLGAMLAGYAAGLARDPWLTVWPALVTGTPVAPGEQPGRPWYFADQAGAALPLAGQESLWTLLAISGGHPVTVAGEWHPDGLLALTAWHGDQAVAL